MYLAPEIYAKGKIFVRVWFSIYSSLKSISAYWISAKNNYVMDEPTAIKFVSKIPY
jgi:hypothetical protein